MPSGVDTKRVGALYALIRTLPLLNYLTAPVVLPRDGVYLFFELGERVSLDGQAVNRIVRVGTHRVDGRFRNRIRQHYGRVRSLGGSRSSSVFRKHVGGAIISRADPRDSRLTAWLKDEQTRFPDLEAEVSRMLRDSFTFVCFRVDCRKERMQLERGLIALLAKHPLGSPSTDWLGRHAVAGEIRSSGLWNVEHVCDDPISEIHVDRLELLVQETLAQGWGR